VKLFSFLWPKATLKPTVTIDGSVSTVPESSLPERVAVVSQPRVYESWSTMNPGPCVDVPLLQIAHGRSGDKGDSVNIGVLARDAKWLPVLHRELTAECVHRYFAHLVAGPVHRFDVPGVNGFNFLLLSALGGGGMASPRSDPLGKAFAQMLLDMPISVPASLLDSATES
jgi:hypothetical protein